MSDNKALWQRAFTTDPKAVGLQVTAGCVRMINSDVEELFAIVPLGTEVTIVD